MPKPALKPESDLVIARSQPQLTKEVAHSQPVVEAIPSTNIPEIKPQLIADKNGKVHSVQLSYECYQGMVEDIEDLTIIAQRVNEETTSHDDFMAELKADGLL